ncbi:MAG: VWA domain-containing protein, partial [Actinomycetales bacterium]|nr:VWA domain-containing protein [Actinomycetales bacterium]
SVRVEDFVAALDALDVMHKPDVYWAGRSTMCASPDDIEIYDRLFSEWFSGINVARVPANESVTMSHTSVGDGGIAMDDDVDELTMVASVTELLRHRDVAKLSPFEARQMTWLFSRLRVSLPRRASRRREPFHRGELDIPAMVRADMRHAGEPAGLRFQRRRLKPRRVVFLVDVSKSMTPYADHMIRLAHRVYATAPNRVEVFTVGTRLTRITRAMRIRDLEQSLEAAGRVIPDWSGGTRLGEGLAAFIDRWGRRGIARGAIVIIASDGWERGDPSLLGEQAARLRRLSKSIVWVNPHRGKAGFAPIQQGMLAVLPHVDHIVAGHTFTAFEELLEVVKHV